MFKRMTFLLMFLLVAVPFVWAGSVTVHQNGSVVASGDLNSMIVDQSGDVDITLGGTTSTCSEQTVSSPSALTFNITKGQTTNPPQQQVSIRNGCVPPLDLPFSVKAGYPSWVVINSTFGTGALNITVNGAAIDAGGQSQSGTVAVDVQGGAGTVTKYVTVNAAYDGGQQQAVPLLASDDSNMWAGEARGTQTVEAGKEKYYKFVVPAQCNKIVVNWTTFDWVGKVDMLVKSGAVPTIDEWNRAVASGYPSRSSASPLWYSLLESSGDGGESVTMAFVPAGTYYIMIKNTRPGASSLYKVWYSPACSYSR